MWQRHGAPLILTMPLRTSFSPLFRAGASPSCQAALQALSAACIEAQLQSVCPQRSAALQVTFGIKSTACMCKAALTSPCAALQITCGNASALDAWQSNTQFPLDKAFLDQEGECNQTLALTHTGSMGPAHPSKANPTLAIKSMCTQTHARTLTRTHTHARARALSHIH